MSQQQPPPTSTLLFSPIRFGNVQCKNRICIAPMCQYSAEDGFVTEWHASHLGARAIGGAGIVMMEATAVEPRGRITANCTGLWKDEHIAPLKRITKFIKSQNSVPAIQLAHSGRKGSTKPPFQGRETIIDEEGGWSDTIGPSPIAFGNGNDRVPKEATLEDIQRVRAAFASAARRAIEAGFELIELHFAHGYLVQSFLSPYSNKRTDSYGGSFENRTRLALEIIRDVKAVIPENYPLFVRISCTDHVPPENGESWDISQSVELAKLFKQEGVHLVDCSSGGNAPINLSQLDVYQIPYSETIRKEAQIATGAVGSIINPKWAEEILQQGKADLILIGRVSLDDPNWPIHAAFELNDLAAQEKVPPQYRWSIGGKPPLGDKWRHKVRVDNNQKELLSSKLERQQIAT